MGNRGVLRVTPRTFSEFPVNQSLEGVIKRTGMENHQKNYKTFTSNPASYIRYVPIFSDRGSYRGGVSIIAEFFRHSLLCIFPYKR